jgi:hypothetical protein
MLYPAGNAARRSIRPPPRFNGLQPARFGPAVQKLAALHLKRGAAGRFGTVENVQIGYFQDTSILLLVHHKFDCVRWPKIISPEDSNNGFAASSRTLPVSDSDEAVRTD